MPSLSGMQKEHQPTCLARVKGTCESSPQLSSHPDNLAISAEVNILIICGCAQCLSKCSHFQALLCGESTVSLVTNGSQRRGFMANAHPLHAAARGGNLAVCVLPLRANSCCVHRWPQLRVLCARLIC